MDINNQDNFSQLINLSLLTTFYTQLKNQFVLIDNYNDFYNSVNQKIQENTKNIDDIKINLNNNYYTKDDIDSEFDLLNQGIMTNYYSKTDIDSKIIVINNNINNLSQNLNNNYYNKTYIDNNFLSLSGGTLQGNLTAPTFIGNLNGNANTSSLANKVSNKLIFTGGFVGEYDGSSELNVIIPTSGATKGILTIQLNGGTTEDVDKITFNGATNKSINITPESIGAITQSILNNYLPLTGGTLTGSLTAPIFNGDLNGNATSASKVNNKLTFSGYQSSIYDGSSDVSITIPNLLSQLTNDTNFATVSYVDSKVSSVYKFKGSVENYSDLPTSGNEVGDVWDIVNADPTNNIKAGDNVVWTGTTWDNLGGMVDLTNYYTKDIIDNKLTTINQSIENINNNLSTNYYNKEYIDNVLNNYLPITGGTVNGSITANEFIGSLSGNATTATTATKLNNKLIFTGDVSAIYDGSQEVTINITAGTQGNYLPIAGGTLTGDLNSRNILPSSNNIYNIGSQNMKYNIIYANTFDGNATSSDISKKVANKLIFTGATTGTYDGSSEITINIPEFQQTNGILTIQLNGGNVEGSNKFTFNGSVNKTINITPSSIGAATSSSLNNYLPLSGGTISGNLYINGNITANTFTGTLSGNATSASKVNNKLTFTGYSSKTYDGSSAISVEIPNKTSQLTNDSGFLTSSVIGEAMRGYTLSRIFPVGSIFTSVNNVNPASFIGGTWERFGKGKVLVGVDEDDSDFNESQKTGGEKEHTLSYAEMPMHNHMAYAASAGAHSHTGRTDANGTHNHDATTESAGAHTHTATTASAGSHSHTGTAASAGAHTHYFDYRDVYRIDARGRGGIGSGYGTGNVYRTSSAGAHTHSVTTVSAGAHTHTTTIASGGTHTHTTTIENDGLHSHNFTTDEVEAHTHSVTVNSSGQSNAHNNLQPYITVYMWIRTA